MKHLSSLAAVGMLVFSFASIGSATDLADAPSLNRSAHTGPTVKSGSVSNDVCLRLAGISKLRCLQILQKNPMETLKNRGASVQKSSAPALQRTYHVNTRRATDRCKALRGEAARKQCWDNLKTDGNKSLGSTPYSTIQPSSSSSSSMSSGY